MNKAVNAIFGLAALLVLYVLAQILLFATFKIPSDSMEPTLYNPQNEMFRLLGTKRSFSQNETFFFSHP